jgi:hypothetical protein
VTTTTLPRRTVRPRRLPPETQAKVDRILAAAPKRQRIKRIRAGLQSLIANGEREWDRRRTAGEGNEPPGLLVDVAAIETDFELLMLELHQ